MPDFTDDLDHPAPSLVTAPLPTTRGELIAACRALNSKVLFARFGITNGEKSLVNAAVRVLIDNEDNLDQMLFILNGGK
jgi:hypothetical protein